MLCTARHPRRVRPFVVHQIGAHHVAVWPRARLADRLDLHVRPHLHPGLLRRKQVVRDQGVLGAEDAAGMAPLGVDAALFGDRERHAVAGVALGVERRGPQSARLRDLLPGGALDSQSALGTGVVAIERGTRDRRGPHPSRRSIARTHVAPLEGLMRRPQRGRQIEVRAATDGVGGDHLGALTLDQQIDVGEVVDVHRLAEVHVAVALAALEHDDRARIDAGRAV